jgi:hypothetical protein
VLLSDFHCTPRVRTTGSNNHQRVLQGWPPSPTWCCAAQETGVVVNRQLAPPSQQWSSTFLALDSDFFGKKPDSCGSSGSLVSWYGSLRLLAVPQTHEVIERKSEESTKHYLTQMLLAINWCYWQVGKNSRMHMKIRGCLVQARFIEIHQVFAKKKKVGYFSNRGLYHHIVWYHLGMESTKIWIIQK